MPEYETVDRAPNPIRLQSVKELRAAVRDDMHHGLTEVFASHTFVGVVDERRRLAAVQGGVVLYLVDYGRACFEYLYQLGLTDFANMGSIRLTPPLDIRALLRAAATQDVEQRRRSSSGRQRPIDVGADVEVDDVVEAVAEKLITFREMLLEYFSLEVTPTGDLVSIPLLVKGYTPPLVKLPRFLLRLGPHVVDWTDEKSCLDAILRELAAFYVPEQLPPPRSGRRPRTSSSSPSSNNTEGASGGEGASANEAPDDGGSGGGSGAGEGNKASSSRSELDEEIEARRAEVRWAVEHVFFPAFKARLVATNSLMRSGVLEVANLKGLYRVFERC